MLDENNRVELSVARRPGTATVIRLVVEYDGNYRVAYATTILYACPPQHSMTVQNASNQLDCGVLPDNSPAVYFPVAMLLISSLIYGCACHFFVWLRCGVSVMITASLVGTILYFRYASPDSSVVVALVVGFLAPGLLALAVFILLWCVCIRPTLQYRQVFGRGPLLRVNTTEFINTNNTMHPVTEPWGGTDSSAVAAAVTTTATGIPGDATYAAITSLAHSVDPGMSNMQPLFPVPEEHATTCPTCVAYNDDPDTYMETSLLDSTASLMDCSGETVGDSWCPRSWSSCCLSHPAEGRATEVFSLKPRRLARLPPVFPATFLIVACLSLLLDQVLSLQSSTASYLSFVIFISCFILFPLCIFKNLAFGLSTALVGWYASLACTCLFLIPNALLPHIVIEQFLRLTWPDYRLLVLRFDGLGLFDVLIFVAWAIGTAIFSSVTLCWVRLQDARELAEAQRGRLYFPNHHPTAIRADEAFVAPLRRTVHLIRASLGRSIRTTPTSSVRFGSEMVQTGYNTPMTGSLAAQGSFEVLETMGSGTFDNPQNTGRVNTERSQLLTSMPHVSYGGLACTMNPPLMPLSRVQLAAGGIGRAPKTNLRPYTNPSYASSASSTKTLQSSRPECNTDSPS